MSFFKVMFDKGHKKLHDEYEKYKGVYEFAYPYLKYVFKYFTPIAAIIIFIFFCVYYFVPSSSSSFSNFSNCTTLSIEGFFSFIDFDKYHINGFFKFFPIAEYFIYSLLIATFIGILLSKAIEDDKERKWEPIKNEAYNEIYTRSKNISHYIAELLGHTVSIVFDPDENIDEKIDKDIADFIKNSKLDCIDNIKVNEITESGIIKFRITEHEVIKFKIKKSKFENCNLKNRLKSRSSELSILQMKYQQYIEPEITKNIIKIQTYLNLAEDTISAYKILPDNKNIKYIVFYLLKAAEFSQEVSKQSKSRITLSDNEKEKD